MNDFPAIAKTLTESLKLRVAPIAVCLTDKAPQGVPGPTKPAAAGCVFWERGAEAAFEELDAERARKAGSDHTA